MDCFASVSLSFLCLLCQLERRRLLLLLHTYAARCLSRPKVRLTVSYEMEALPHLATVSFLGYPF